MAVVFTYRGSLYSTTAASTYTATPAWTPAPGSLLLAFFVNTYASSPVDPTGVVGHGVTYTKLTLPSNLISTTHIVSVWVAIAPASPTSAAAVATVSGTTTGAAIIEFEVTHWGGTTAVSAVKQNPVGTGTTGTTGTVTLSAAASLGNRAIAFFVHLANEASTPRANWTETSGADGNFNQPATGAQVQFRADAFETTATATWTTSINWRGVALEIQVNLFTGTGSEIAPVATLAGAGKERLIGTAALIAPVATLASIGKERFRGTAALTAPVATLTSAGHAGFKTTGTGALAAASLFTGAGKERHIGTGAEAAISSFAGAGKERFRGAGAAAATSLFAGIGKGRWIGAGAAAATSLFAGVGKERFSGTGATVAPAATLISAGHTGLASSGSLVAYSTFTGAGYCGFKITGTGAVVAPHPTFAAVGRSAFSGTATIAAAATLAGVGYCGFETEGWGAVLAPVANPSAHGKACFHHIGGGGTITAGSGLAGTDNPSGPDNFGDGTFCIGSTGALYGGAMPGDVLFGDQGFAPFQLSGSGTSGISGEVRGAASVGHLSPALTGSRGVMGTAPPPWYWGPGQVAKPVSQVRGSGGVAYVGAGSIAFGCAALAGIGTAILSIYDTGVLIRVPGVQMQFPVTTSTGFGHTIHFAAGQINAVTTGAGLGRIRPSLKLERIHADDAEILLMLAS